MLDALQYEFMRNALIAGLLSAVACGIIGAYVVVKKMVSVSGAISHSSFGGIGMGYFLGISPVLGALFFTIASALVMGLVIKRTKLPEDTAIGILWAMGMAIGIIFIGLTPGYAPDLFSYLFGNILAISSQEVLLSVGLSVVILLVIIFLYNDLFSTTFDEQFAKITGINTKRINVALMFLTAITVVLAVKVVGIMLVSAMLILPAATALQMAKGFKAAMITAAIIAVFAVLAGITISFYADLPAGATVVMVNFLLFALSFLVKRFVR